MGKRYFVIGIGGYGLKIASELSQKMKKDGASVFSVAVDTDSKEIDSIVCDYKFDLSFFGDFASVLLNLQKKDIEFYPDINSYELSYPRILSMDKGSFSWRMKAYISFVNYMAEPENKSRVDSLLESISSNPEVESEFYFVGSLAGGTSSALAMPIALYIRKFFRENNYKKFKTLFFATSPDIFALSMNGELKTKAFANAYACLSEINTVNLVANRKDVKNFVLGTEGKSFGKLFDGKSGEFNYKECAPFNDVIIFDRTPLVNSIESFGQNICSHIYYYYLGVVTLRKNKNFNNVGIYSGYSVSELNYSLEDTLNYLSGSLTNKKINEELIFSYNGIKNQFIIEEVSNKDISESEVFARKTQAFVENLKDPELDNCSLLLNRDKEYEFGRDINDDEWASDYFNWFRKHFLAKILENEKLNLFNEEIEKLYFTKNEKNKINFSNKKNKEKNTEFFERYKKLFDQLINAFSELIENSFNEENIDKIINSDEKLCIKNILIEEEKFVHPTIALVKLSQIFNIFTKKSKAYGKLTDKEIYNSIIFKEFPSVLYDLDGVSFSKFGYGKLPGIRLYNVFYKNNLLDEKNNNRNKNIYKIYNPKRDENYIVSDLKNFYENGILAILGIYINKALPIFNEILDKYREYFDCLKRTNEKLKKQVDDLIIPEELQTNFYQIGASNKNREQTLKKYLFEIKKKADFSIDDQYGKIVFESIKDANFEDIEKVTRKTIFKICEIEKTKLKESQTYNYLANLNVFSAMCDASTTEYSKSLLSKACKIKPSLLTNNSPKEIERKTLFINQEVADFVLENAQNLSLRATSPVEAVEELLSNIGAFDAQVIIYEPLSNSKAFVVAQKSNIELENVTKIKCEDGLALYEKEYVKAIASRKEYATEMWNPHIFVLDKDSELSEI